MSALTASGADGIADLRAIISGAREFLTDGGLLALETGISQHATLKELAANSGFAACESRQDLTERDRYFFATAPAST
jgi:release factor glutamine methyltransferase